MLTDQSKMPFGKYAGETLVNIPGGYFFWLETEINKKPGMRHNLNENHLLKYIEENRAILEKELYTRKQS